jgi:membrane dipeptidase
MLWRSFRLVGFAFVMSFSISKAAEVSAEALRIHRNALVIDGHNDFPWEMRTKLGMSFDFVDMTRFITNFHTDIPRLKQGGVGAQFWAVYVPTLTMKTGGAARQTLEQIDLVHRMIAKYPETFAWAATADEIVAVRESGKIASLIGIEGGHSIENSLALLRIYYQLGARYMTLTHSDSLPWADAATDKPRSNGLSDFGREVVKEMNRVGMLVDISHVAPSTMEAALNVSKAPVIASHSSAYAIAPHPRNIPDDILLRIKKNNGVVMVNFFSGFVVAESAKIMSSVLEVTRELREKYPEEKDYEKAMREWRQDNPMPAGSVKDLVNHIDHIVKVAGIDHVGLGSDFDGVSKTPVELPDVSSYPVITQELLDRKYSEADIQKILGGNILRALRDAEKVAKEMSAP